jgi:hypothetical protein
MNRASIGALLLAGIVIAATPAASAGVKPRKPPLAVSKVVANVPSYSVSPSLKEVANLAAFRKAGLLDAPTKAMLAKNLMACGATDGAQLFHVYENNDYRNLPSFVTSDLVLQVYHIFYDFTLRTVETESLLPALKKLTSGMLDASLVTYKHVGDPDLKKAALKNVAYFGVAAKALGIKRRLPPGAAAMVAKETALINAHGGRVTGAMFPYGIDYSQFIPRGHYTRSEALKKFFRAMMWYGLVPFKLGVATSGHPDTGAYPQVHQGLLFVNDLYRAKLDGAWERVYEPTKFYVGAADDLTPAEWKKLMDGVYGVGTNPAAFADPTKLAAFTLAAENARPAAIQQIRDGTQLRFMGQRDIPDSEVMQALGGSEQRPFPAGLDVMAVFGDKRAATILDKYPQVYNPGGWTGYQSARDALAEKFAALPPKTWSSNLYWSWLDSLNILQAPAPNGYPSFMRKEVWRDKTLYTSLASWAELRHDTILYGKQSTAECGGGQPKPPPFVRGYVEPSIQFYDRLRTLTEQSRQGLEARKLMPADLRQHFDDFEDLLDFLIPVSAKELTGKKLTREEYESIRYIGGQVERLTLDVMTGSPTDWSLVSEADRDMATAADVHTASGAVLEEGVGHATEILVIVPIEGKLTLTRGAAFSYYEFEHPSNDRLTDEKWQGILNHNGQPPSPIWTRTFLLPGKPHKIDQGEIAGYDSGC